MRQSEILQLVEQLKLEVVHHQFLVGATCVLDSYVCI